MNKLRIQIDLPKDVVRSIERAAKSETRARKVFIELTLERLFPAQKAEKIGGKKK